MNMKKLRLLATIGLLSAGVGAGITVVNTPMEVRAEESSESIATSETVQESSADPKSAAETPVKESGWDAFVKQYLTADKVAMYMSWVAYIGTIIGLVANINKLKKANNLTLKGVSDEVKKELRDNVGKEVKEQAERFLPTILATQEKTNEILKAFSKMMALSQQNTPESRVAILELIENLGTLGKEVTDNAKAAIDEEVKAIEEHKEKIEDRLDEIIDSYDGTSI